MCKILPHKFFPDAEWWIWVDSNLTMKINPEDIIEYFGNPEHVGLHEHPERETIKQEIEIGLKRQLDDPEKLKYHKDKKGRLAACNVIVRRNTPAVRQLCEAWWAEICAGSSRDQLSFPYTLGTIAELRACEGIKYWKDNAVYTYSQHKKPNNWETAKS